MKDSQTAPDPKVGVFQLALLVFTILVLCALVVDTILVLPREASDLIHIADKFACAVFFFDFCIRFCQAESKRTFMKWGWIDLLASIPNLELLRWGRLVRVLRVIRLLRGVRSVQKVLALIFENKLRGGAVSIAFTAFLLVAFSSVSVLICERHGDANIKTAEDAVWWSVTTFTTVGYGDKYPVTTEGRVLAMILMVGGVGMFGAISGLAASFFLGGQQSQKSSETEEIMARLDQMQAKLEAMSQERGT
ncbi:MAG: ion transporter [Verrucomicrobia bacterium]|nr:ion transporter [Verrucomicrobiota bacterium]